MRFPGLLCHQSRQARARIFSPALGAVTQRFSLCACRNQEQYRYSLKWLLELYSECRLLFLFHSDSVSVYFRDWYFIKPWKVLVLAISYFPL